MKKKLSELKPFYEITSKIECQTFDKNNDPLFSLEQMVFAMEKYHQSFNKLKSICDCFYEKKLMISDKLICMNCGLPTN